MSVDSTKQILRKLDFPLCVKESLSRIEQLCTSNAAPNVERIQNIKQTDLALELISEFVFCEVDRRNNRRKRLNRIQEMQLLEVLCDYFAFSHNGTVGGDAARNTVFMSLFPVLHTDRYQFLVKLVSIAVCTNNIPLLSATGVLMQQVGCTSKFSIELARGLINDYFVLLPDSISKLKELPSKAPLFTANFLTALTEIYFVPGADDQPLIPTKELLNVLTEWVSDSSLLCYTALTSNLLHSLPSGGIPMVAITPFVGLFRWCIVAPLYIVDNSNLLAKLHLATLKSLLEAPTHCPSSTERSVVAAQHICNLIQLYNEKVGKIMKGVNTDDRIPEEIEFSLERLSQFVQIALYTNCIYGSKQEMVTRLQSLPKTRLLQITLAKYKEII